MFPLRHLPSVAVKSAQWKINWVNLGQVRLRQTLVVRPMWTQWLILAKTTTQTLRVASTCLLHAARWSAADGWFLCDTHQVPLWSLSDEETHAGLEQQDLWPGPPAQRAVRHRRGISELSRLHLRVRQAARHSRLQRRKPAFSACSESLAVDSGPTLNEWAALDLYVSVS